MNDTTNNTQTGSAEQPQIPRAKLWIIGGMFLVAAIGMYAGTMYRIQNHGYVGIGDDRPIAKPVDQTSN